MNQIEENNGEGPLLPYYVYVLMDDESKEVFYVGKGTGDRALHHVAEVKRKIDQGQLVVRDKQKKIQELVNNDKLLVRVIARFETEVEAFAVESVAIKWFYGFDNLTNEVLGHRGGFVRAKGKFEELPHLDIAARNRDGTYRDNNLDQLERLGANDLLNEIKCRMVDEGFIFRDFTNDGMYDPGKSNGWLGVLVQIQKVDFIVAFSKTRIPAISIANTEYSRTDDALVQLRSYSRMGPDFVVNGPKSTIVKGEGRYRDFNVKPRFSKSNSPDLEGMFEFLKKLNEWN